MVERTHARTKITASGETTSSRENANLILIKTKGNDSTLKDLTLENGRPTTHRLMLFASLS